MELIESISFRHKSTLSLNTHHLSTVAIDKIFRARPVQSPHVKSVDLAESKKICHTLVNKGDTLSFFILVSDTGETSLAFLGARDRVRYRMVNQNGLTKHFRTVDSIAHTIRKMVPEHISLARLNVKVELDAKT